MKDMHSRQMGSQGFSLVELLVVMAISTIVLTAIVGVFTGLARSYTTESARTTAQQDIRAAMDLMAMEIREVGLDPTGKVDTAGIVNGFVTANTPTDATANSIEFVADLDYDGTLGTGEQFRYAVADGKLRRQMDGAAASVTDDDVLLSNVVANTADDPDNSGSKMPVFAYYDEDGDRTTTVDDIRVVAITLTIQEPAGQNGDVTRTLTQRVRLRNSN